MKVTKNGVTITRPMTPGELLAAKRLRKQAKIGYFKRRKPRIQTYASDKNGRKLGS